MCTRCSLLVPNVSARGPGKSGGSRGRVARGGIAQEASICSPSIFDFSRHMTEIRTIFFVSTAAIFLACIITPLTSLLMGHEHAREPETSPFTQLFPSPPPSCPITPYPLPPPSTPKSCSDHHPSDISSLSVAASDCPFYDDDLEPPRARNGSTPPFPPHAPHLAHASHAPHHYHAPPPAWIRTLTSAFDGHALESETAKEGKRTAPPSVRSRSGSNAQGGPGCKPGSGVREEALPHDWRDSPLVALLRWQAEQTDVVVRVGKTYPLAIPGPTATHTAWHRRLLFYEDRGPSFP